jgi:hypothetical protein
VDGFRELFTKHDHMIPMRDGIKLYTTLFVPKLVSSAAADSREAFLRHLPHSDTTGPVASPLPAGTRRRSATADANADETHAVLRGTLRHRLVPRAVWLVQDIRERGLDLRIPGAWYTSASARRRPRALVDEKLGPALRDQQLCLCSRFADGPQS